MTIQDRDRYRTIFHPMHARCDNPKHRAYKYYGAKGIKVCGAWHSFEIFKAWLIANGWKKGLHLHRIDGDGDYCPENCKIVTAAENMQGRKSTKLNWEKVVEIRRLALEGFTTYQIAKMFGIGQPHTSQIINRKKWAK